MSFFWCLFYKCSRKCSKMILCPTDLMIPGDWPGRRGQWDRRVGRRSESANLQIAPGVSVFRCFGSWLPGVSSDVDPRGPRGSWFLLFTFDSENIGNILEWVSLHLTVYWWRLAVIFTLPHLSLAHDARIFEARCCDRGLSSKQEEALLRRDHLSMWRHIFW